MSGYYYRAALCLSSLLALTTLVVRGVIAHPNPEVATSLNPVITATFILPLGLWVGSNFIRYVGAALLVPWAGGLIWPIISSGLSLDRSLVAFLFVFTACLCLCMAWLLLLSRKFRAEFAEEQKFQPRYKTHLRRALLCAASIAMVIGALHDIAILYGIDHWL